MQEKIFHFDGVIDDVTGRPQIRFSLSFIKERDTLFVITETRTKISSSNSMSHGDLKIVILYSIIMKKTFLRDD